MKSDPEDDFNSLMVEVPPGEIELRDDRTKQKWIVLIQCFLLSKFPVTQDLYGEITGKSPSSFNGGLLPVETVSWKDAIDFCNVLSERMQLNQCYFLEDDRVIFDSNADGYRLPTEAEWEYGCKAGSPGVRYGELDQISWYKDNSAKMTHDVGMKQPNQFGIYDMPGNVWEWCSDLYDETVYGSYRIFRGGGWNDDERGCMATNRRRSHPLSFKIDDLGFRLARNIVK